MRKQANSWLVGLMIGAIIVVFVLWGIGTFRSAQFQVVAKVNGHNIYLPEYSRAYQNLLRAYQERLGSDFTEEVARSLNLKSQAINQLIDERLIRQAGERLGLTVTDAELRHYIRSLPIFADERGFNEKRYYQILARQRLPASDYENYERQRLAVQKVINFITSFAKVTDTDLEEAFRLENEAVRVEYLVVNPARFASQQKVTDKEVEEFYRTQAELFREPEKFRADMIYINIKEIAQKLKIDSQKLEDFFYQNLEQFSQPQAIRVREVRLELPAQATPAEQQRLRQLADNMLKSVQGGVPWEQVLRQVGQSAGTRLQLEDLGVVKRGQKPPAWEAVAFSLQKGESGLAKTDKGLHLVQVLEIVEKKAPSLSAVQAQVEAAWRQAEASRLAQEQAAALRQEMVKSSLSAVAKEHNLPVIQTPLLSVQDPLPTLGVQPAVSQAALTLKPLEISKPIPLANGVVLLQVLARQEAFIPPLEQIKDRVAGAVRQEKAQKAAAQEARQLLTRLRHGEPLAKVAQQAGLTIKDSGFFTRLQGFPGYPQARELVTTAFSLDAQRPLAPEPLSWQGDSLILVFKDRRQPEATAFAQAKEEIQKSLLELKRQMVFSQWLAEERQRAKIKIYELPS